VRVVFDTNILVSALALPGGRADEAMLRIIRGQDRLIVSKEILRELLAVLARKFSHDSEELAHVAVYLAGISELVRPRRRIAILKDQADNRILEAARAGRADLIVTGDRAMLKAGRDQHTRIISLNEYLQG
jgi:putative PIN family toxin of toxin-antitoxin system